MQHAEPVNPVPTGTSTGLDQNLAGALTYLFGFITGIIFLVIEKKSPFVRFHAAQSTFLWGLVFVVMIGISILSMIASAIPAIGWILGILFFLVSLGLAFGSFILWIFLMYKAYSGEEWEFPWAGRQARQTLLKGG